MKPIHNLIKDTGDIVRLSGSEYKTLVENSKNYEGEDYKRRVISEMIRLADENLNIPHTQLLAKWDLYIVEVQEELFEDAGKEFSPEVLNHLKNYVGDDIVLSLGWFDGAVKELPGYRPRLDDVVWQEKGIDLDDQNAFATEETWGSDVIDEILNKGSVSILVHLDETSKTTNAQTIIDAAKESGLKIQTGAQLALFRAYNFADAFGDLAEVKVVVHGTAEFFGSAVNTPLMREVLTWLKVDDSTYHAHATTFNKNGYFGGDEVMVHMSLTGDGTHTKQIEASRLDNTDLRLYYSEDVRELAHIEETYASMAEDLNPVTMHSLDADGNLGKKIPVDGAEEGYRIPHGEWY